jgi:hypothetical protein
MRESFLFIVDTVFPFLITLNGCLLYGKPAIAVDALTGCTGLRLRIRNRVAVDWSDPGS